MAAMNLEQLYRDALAAQKSGDLAQAESCYRQLLSHALMPEAIVNYANVLAAQGREGEAMVNYDRALTIRPGMFEALYNRSNLLLKLKRAQDALAGYDQALAMRPKLAAVWNNRGTALRALKRLDEALASYDQALAISPGHLNALANRAIILFDLKQYDEALAAVEDALGLDPSFAEAYYIQGNVLRDKGRIEAALASYEQALRCNPLHPHALNAIARSALTLCDWTRSCEVGAKLRYEIEANRSIIQPFVLLGYSDDPALQHRCAENYVRQVAPVQPQLWDGTLYQHERIRLAYVSADFHQHPTAMLLAEVFERHDRRRFEVSGIGFGPDDKSAMRARVLKAFDHFENVRNKSDFEVARLLNERQIDIAVDLNGHTHEARPGIFSYRPAPLQINYLVYPGTMGARFMTHIIADRVVLPQNQQPFFSEKIVHLPDCYQANDATREIPAPPSRQEAGLPQSGFVFCCFNNSWKITAPVFEIWMRLLRAVPQSLLWLLESPGEENLRRRAHQHGIDPARLVFAPKIAPPMHLARHRLADLFLDTLPYNAHTTASDALWAGLPLITCMGLSFQSRVAASLLEAINLPELVTTTPCAYEALALELASNPDLLDATRQKLARNRLTTALFDTQRFCNALEALYQQLLL